MRASLILVRLPRPGALLFFDRAHSRARTHARLFAQKPRQLRLRSLGHLAHVAARLIDDRSSTSKARCCAAPA
eukprot:2956838-Prymnesium_polylepis.1